MRSILKLIFSLYCKVKSLFFTIMAKYTCGRYIGLLKANGYTRLTKNCYLGSNVHFNGMIISGSGVVKIGDNFHSGSQCQIITQNHNIYGSKLPYDSSYIIKNVTIEDNVWLGDRVLILPGVTVGEGAVIQAGSTVVSNIDALCIAGGHPARVFSKRDADHYYKLKSEKEFH